MMKRSILSLVVPVIMGLRPIGVYAEDVSQLDPNAKAIAEYLVKNGKKRHQLITNSNLGEVPSSIVEGNLVSEGYRPVESMKFNNIYSVSFKIGNKEMTLSYNDNNSENFENGYDGIIGSGDLLEIRIGWRVLNDVSLDGKLNELGDYAAGFGASAHPADWDLSTAQRINGEYQDQLKWVRANLPEVKK